MLFRMAVAALVVCVGIARTEAQFFGPSPHFFGPSSFDSGSRGISIQSPFFQMELSPYGNRLDATSLPYLPAPGLSPRGWRPPSLSYPGTSRFFGRTTLVVPIVPPSPSTRLGLPVPLPGDFSSPRFSASNNEDDEWGPSVLDPLNAGVIEPAPVPAPVYDIPSYSDVFPEREPSAVESASQRMADRMLRAVDRLRARLASRDAEEVWNQYLQLDQVESIADQLREASDWTTISVAQVEGLLLNFNAVTASPELGWIRSSTGFEDIRSSLASLADALTETEVTQTTAPQTPGDQETNAADARNPDAGIEDLPAPTGQRLKAPAPLEAPAQVLDAPRPQRRYRAEL
jgi:hypothetical protein